MLGLVLAFVCRFLVELTARRRAAAADKRLRGAVHEVSSELVVAPLEAELGRFGRVRAGLDVALKE